MATKILSKIILAGQTIASRVHSEKLNEEVWIVHHREVWDMIADSRVKYSEDELPMIQKMTDDQVKSAHLVKKIYPSSEVVSVKKNRTIKTTDRGGS